MVSLDKFNGSCNTLDDPCVPNKTEDLNLTTFNIITEIKQ